MYTLLIKLCKLDRGEADVIVVVDVRYVYTPLKSLDQSQTSLHDK